MVETKIDSTGTHVKNYVVDSKEQDLQEPIDEPAIMDRTAPKEKAYQSTVSASDIKPQVLEDSPIITFHATLPEVELKPVETKPIFTIKPPAKLKPTKPSPVKDTIVDTKPVTKPPKSKPIDSKPDSTKAPTKKPKPVKDTIVDGNPDVIATKPIKPKPQSTKAPTKKPKPIKDTIVDAKPDVVTTKPVKPPTKKPVKVKPAKPAKPAKPTKPVIPVNDLTPAPNQGPFPGLSFLWSLYRRPLVTVVGAFLNRPETGLNWIPFIANAPTLPPWPPKLPWERFPIIG